jgi:hypothetical protein
VNVNPMCAAVNAAGAVKTGAVAPSVECRPHHYTPESGEDAEAAHVELLAFLDEQLRRGRRSIRRFGGAKEWEDTLPEGMSERVGAPAAAPGSGRAWHATSLMPEMAADVTPCGAKRHTRRACSRRMK